MSYVQLLCVFNLNCIYLHVTLMVCFKANFFLRENKILSYFLKQPLHSIWQSKAVHSKLGVQSERNYGSRAVSCWYTVCSLWIISYGERSKGADGVYTWRRSERYLGTEPVITLIQKQHAVHLICNSAGSQRSSWRRDVHVCLWVDLKSSLAAEFWTVWGGWMTECAEPMRMDYSNQARKEYKRWQMFWVAVTYWWIVLELLDLCYYSKQ